MPLPSNRSNSELDKELAAKEKEKEKKDAAAAAAASAADVVGHWHIHNFCREGSLSLYFFLFFFY